MKENNLNYFKKKSRDFKEWFLEKHHPHSTLNKTVFIHDLLKFVGLSLIFLIVYSNADKLNQLNTWIIQIGSIILLVLLYFIIRKGWHLWLNLKYWFRGFNNGVKLLIAIVIVLLLLLAFFNQERVVNDIKSTYDKINFSRFSPIDLKSISLLASKYLSVNQSTKSTQDSLVSSCIKDYNECVSISEAKYDISFSLIKAERFEDMSKAEEFYNTWKGFLQFDLKSDLMGWDYYEKDSEDYLPMVLIASTMKGPGGQLPSVIICDKNGDLIQTSKSNLLC